MTTNVITVDEQATLRQAAARLRDADVGTLVILRGRDVAGIVSERDVVRALATGADPDQVWVSDVMTDDPRYLTEADNIGTALRIMLAAGIRHLPVLSESQLVGIVSMRALAEHLLQ